VVEVGTRAIVMYILVKLLAGAGRNWPVAAGGLIALFFPPKEKGWGKKGESIGGRKRMTCGSHVSVSGWWGFGK
jgi:hypothetical protein